MKAISFFVTVALAGVSVAQFGMGTSSFDMQSRPFAVLQRPEIRKEIKLTKDQSKQIDDIVKGMSRQNASDPLNAMGKMDESEKAMVAILEDPQKQRLSEIRVQIRGATSLSDPEVAKALDINADVQAKINQIREDSIHKYFGAIQGGKRGGLDKYMKELSQQEEKDILALLDDKQREGLVKLAGEPFKRARMEGNWPL